MGIYKPCTIMNRFEIVYTDGVTVVGFVSCSKEEFLNRFIIPSQEDIQEYGIEPEKEYEMDVDDIMPEAEDILAYEAMHQQEAEIAEKELDDIDGEEDIVQVVDVTYVVASTSHKLGMMETYVFPSNEQGQIVDYSELGGRALRFGDLDYDNHAKAVEEALGSDYACIREWDTPNGNQSLWKHNNQ